MPLFEYHCEPCDKNFEKLSKQQADTEPCPDCGKGALKAVSVLLPAQVAPRQRFKLWLTGLIFERVTLNVQTTMAQLRVKA